MSSLVVPAGPVLIPLQQTMLTMPRTVVTSVHLGTSGGETAAAAADQLVTIFIFQNKMSDTARQVPRHWSALPVGSRGGGWGGGREGGEQSSQDLLPHGDSKNEPAADFAGRGISRDDSDVAVLAAGPLPRHN